jgi:cytochrome P450
VNTVAEVTFGRHAEVSAVLADPRFAVLQPSVESEDSALGWVRANVSRFSTGATHERRRGLASAELDRLVPAVLRREAMNAALAARPAAEDTIARTVPVQVLADGLGLRSPVTNEVAVLASGYHPGTDAGPSAAQALAYLVRVCDGGSDELTAARIGLLVQAYDATAGLIVNAIAAWRRFRPDCPVPVLLAETLRYDPPVRIQRRVCRKAAVVGTTPVGAGSLVRLDVAAANRDPAAFADPDRFDPTRAEADRQLTLGSGLRPCPGRDHAFAIATGVVEALSMMDSTREGHR